ncbi:MAG: choice-of-anchor Q domain-containing protein [Chloroflexota bacterium]
MQENLVQAQQRHWLAIVIALLTIGASVSASLLTTEAAFAAEGDITTIAGTDQTEYNGDNIDAATAHLHRPLDMAIDSESNIYIVDENHNRIRRIDADGIITTVAGDGIGDDGTFGGDGGQATTAQLNKPQGVAVDVDGNIYIADTENNRIRRVDAETGIITTMAGNGSSDEDDISALEARIILPVDVLVGHDGHVYLAEIGTDRVRQIDVATGMITTVAGSGAEGNSTEGILATESTLASPRGMVMDSAGNLYIAETSAHKILKVDAATGILSTFAGTGTQGREGDNMAATAVELSNPVGLSIDGDDNLFIADGGSNRIRRVDAVTGILTTIAGTTELGHTGDDGPATDAELGTPYGVLVDYDGNVIISNSYTNRIRVVETVATPLLAPLDFDGHLVNSTEDTSDASPGDGICADASGACTLRAAIEEANAASDSDTITIDSTLLARGTNGVSSPNATVMLTQGPLRIISSLHIIGSANDPLVVDAGNQFQVATITGNSIVTIENLVLQNGVATEQGGGIYNTATLTLRNATVKNSTAGGSGAGITNSGGTLVIENSLIEANTTQASGGGVRNQSNGIATIRNSTISGNAADDIGGGVDAPTGNVRLEHVTVVDNSAGNGGSGIAYDEVTIVMSNTLIANNQGGLDCLRLQSNENTQELFVNNLIMNATHSCGMIHGENGNIVGVDSDAEVGVDDLGNNGGTTLTHALSAGSLAIDAIPNGASGCGTDFTSDQRGTTRPTGNGCDIGAFEYVEDTGNDSEEATPDPTTDLELKKLMADDGTEGDAFGYTAAIDGDFAIIGAPDADGGGAAYIFERNYNGNDNWGQVTKLTAGDESDVLRFGQSVAISGDVAIVGANANDDNGVRSGAAYIFERNQDGPDNWGKVTKRTGSEASNPDAGFGKSVSIHGDVAIVGAAIADENMSQLGTAYIFERNQDGANAWGEVIKLTASDGTNGDQFGASVATNGEVVAVGAIGDFSGRHAVYIFERTPGGTNPWTEVVKRTSPGETRYSQFGRSVAISGNLVIAGNDVHDPEAAYIFDRNQDGDNQWGHLASLTRTDDPTDENIGEAVAISEDVAIVRSSVFVDGSRDRAGATYVYERSLSNPAMWAQITQLTDNDTATSEDSAQSVAVSGRIAIVGATHDDEQGTDAGAAYLYVLAERDTDNDGTPDAIDDDDDGDFFLDDEDMFPFNPDASAIILDTLVGDGKPEYKGDGGDAGEASVNGPRDVHVDDAGNIYIADVYNQVIRKVDTDGVITTIAGTGTEGFSEDGILATEAMLRYPRAVTVDDQGNVYLTDKDNHLVRRIDAETGILTTVAGNGTGTYAGDNGPATDASVRYPVGVALDSAGNLYITDHGNRRIRKVDTDGVITTIAGNGKWGNTGDGGPSEDARVGRPTGILVDDNDNIYFADWSTRTIRKIDANGIISTVAGNGTKGYSGDGGPATEAQLDRAKSMAFDAAGNMYIADDYNHVIRMVDTDGIITTVAGNNTEGYFGDDRDPTIGQLNRPYDVEFHAPTGAILIADRHNNRIRQIVPGHVDDTPANVGNTEAGIATPPVGIPDDEDIGVDGPRVLLPLILR